MILAAAAVLAAGQAWGDDDGLRRRSVPRWADPGLAAIVDPGAFQAEAGTQVWSSGGFFNGRLVPRVHRQLERVGAGDLAVFPGRALEQETYFGDVTGRARDGMERGASRALREFLLEETALGRALTGIGQDVVKGVGLGTGVRFDVRVSHLAPELVVRPEVGRGQALSFSIRATGALGVSFVDPRLMRGARLGAHVNPQDGAYGLSFLLRF